MIKVTTSTETKNESPKFPCLKKWMGPRPTDRQEKYGDIIVLFTSRTTAVYLTGVESERIGKERKNLFPCDSTYWKDSDPVTISNV